MATGKKTTPAPIDRPLSRAYLREFTGWSTAYPPGISDPTSLRVMENVLLNRDGSVSVRPGLRSVLHAARWAVSPAAADFLHIVGSFEPFYANDGTVAYLFCARQNIISLYYRFYVAQQRDDDGAWYVQTLSEAGFTFGSGGEEMLLQISYVKYLQMDNKIIALTNASAPVVFEVGASKKQYKPDPLVGALAAGLMGGQPTSDWVGGAQNTVPGQGVPTYTNALFSTDPDLNVHKVGVFCTFSTVFGESRPSEILWADVQRPLGGWSMSGYFGIGSEVPEPGGYYETTTAIRSADQFWVRFANGAQWADALAAGATAINWYVFGWSKEGAPPTEARLAKRTPLTPTSNMGSLDGCIVLNPQNTGGIGTSRPIPWDLLTDSRTEVLMYKTPSQGIVASDRMVLVKDGVYDNRIWWSSGTPGDYLNLSLHEGGGFKTLPHGNLQIPATVKLWQNPQSVDTLIILCKGTAGEHTSYYMQPAEISGQADSTAIMGFEETTNTPGTVSPYGCEVANNALYHPLEDQLMKSTASNYNVNHKSVTDQIANRWVDLVNKEKIVSCLFDQRLYYLVHNPKGAAIQPECNGNEVWVYDLASKNGAWSRWLTQGVSLKKLEYKGRLHLCLVRPDGMFIFDETYTRDDVVSGGAYVSTPIPWRIETNTQGANRAHDAWAHLQQVNTTLGNFRGQMRYGVKGHDMHGMTVDKSKLHRASATQADVAEVVEDPFDVEDFLEVKRDLKEWFFYASSVEGEPSAGQINLVQYRYTPVSVNIGYDFGSIETFEYGRAGANWSDRTTDNGVPIPYIDTTRP